MLLFDLLLALTRTVGLLAPAAQPKLRIMPLGDSITEVTCWRALLWESLALAGLGDQVEFVGSMVDNLGLCLGQLNTVLMHHEGHIGFLASDIANYELPHWLNMANPDIVMFMLGTNDIQQGHRTNDILAAYTTMVQEMRANNPKMKIIVDRVIPLPVHNREVEALNAAIPNWVQSQNTTESPIYIADTNTGFTAQDLRDGVHPNAAGDEIIACGLFPVLLRVINESLEENIDAGDSHQAPEIPTPS